MSSAADGVPVRDPADRLRVLLEANRSVVSDLSLPVVLERIVEAARRVAGARYAALGILGADGGLEAFLHSGLEPAEAAAIGGLPHGRGLLGALIEDPHPIRTEHLRTHPRAVGFPPHHPPMDSFLGVPVQIRDEVFGNLYLTDRLGGGGFTEEDEQLVLALAATASTAIDNARLYAESRRQRDAMRALAEINQHLLDPTDDGLNILRRIAESVLRLVDADVVTVIVGAGHKSLRVEAAAGAQSEALTGMVYPRAGSLATEAMDDGRALIVDRVRPGQFLHLDRYLDVGPLMALPLAGSADHRGAVIVARRPNRRRFEHNDLSAAASFANQAALALELARGRARQERLSVLEDRERIARDLHDHVIQRLFATGLAVQSLAASSGETVARSRADRAVDDIDETIRQIRTAIFQLQGEQHTAWSLRARVIEIAEKLTPALGFRPVLRFVGPIDTVGSAGLVADVEAVVRESLANAAKHAKATRVEVTLRASAEELVVEVVDDGRAEGAAPAMPRRPDGGRSGLGLANLRSRAEARRGSLLVERRPGAGTLVRWSGRADSTD